MKKVAYTIPPSDRLGDLSPVPRVAKRWKKVRRCNYRRPLVAQHAPGLERLELLVILLAVLLPAHVGVAAFVVTVFLRGGR